MTFSAFKQWLMNLMDWRKKVVYISSMNYNSSASMKQWTITIWTSKYRLPHELLPVAQIASQFTYSATTIYICANDFQIKTTIWAILVVNLSFRNNKETVKIYHPIWIISTFRTNHGPTLLTGISSHITNWKHRYWSNSKCYIKYCYNAY